jgi:hypothetical protein
LTEDGLGAWMAFGAGYDVNDYETLRSLLKSFFPESGKNSVFNCRGFYETLLIRYESCLKDKFLLLDVKEEITNIRNL